ncbi:SynChlorMet cassette radical SAM/SPASM protein ScmF [Thermodesulfobacteriota bacterium]
MDNENIEDNINPGFSLDQIYFYLTEGCNLACRHCWLAPPLQTGGKKHPVLPVSFFKKAVSEAIPLGLSGVKLTGGEPLLHPDIKEIFSIIRNNDLALTMETNGFLCSMDIAEEIAESSDRFVSVSIDGADSKTHDIIRGVGGSFEKAKDAVKNLVKTGITTQVIMSLMPRNRHQVESMVTLARDLGAESLKINIVQPIARGKDLFEKEKSLKLKDIIELGKYIEAKLSRETDFRIDFDYPLAFKPLSYLADKGSGTCTILNIIGVIATGEYALCGIGNHIPELVFGKVEDIPLKDIWLNNPVLNEIRNGIPGRLDGVCAECLMKQMCLGSCIALTYYRTKKLWAPFWFCDLAYREGLFPKTRLATQSSSTQHNENVI